MATAAPKTRKASASPRRARTERSTAKRGSSRANKSSSRATKRAGTTRYWSGRVTRESDALDLDPGVFRSRSARAIAASLKRSAEHSKRRKSEPYRSAMSMLTFYINRAGKNLSASQLRTLDRAKAELRRAYGRDPSGRASPPRSKRQAG